MLFRFNPKHWAVGVYHAETADLMDGKIMSVLFVCPLPMVQIGIILIKIERPKEDGNGGKS